MDIGFESGGDAEGQYLVMAFADEVVFGVE